MPEGRVIRAYSNFCDVMVSGRVHRCTLRGKLRRQDVEVLTGDLVVVEIAADGTGTVREVLPRRSELYRPPIANVDTAIVVFTLKEPPVNFPLVDRLTVLAGRAGLDVVLCLNKADLCDPAEVEPVTRMYEKASYPMVVTSARTGEGLDRLKSFMEGRISVLAGQSGVGKSSLLNVLVPGWTRPTGEVSRKLQRGRHTTKWVELLEMPAGGFVADTPGFSRLELEGVDPASLAQDFPEMRDFAGKCRFPDCLHRCEPDCAVKAAVEAGDIPEGRYRSYLELLREAEEFHQRRYIR